MDGLKKMAASAALLGAIFFLAYGWAPSSPPKARIESKAEAGARFASAPKKQQTVNEISRRPTTDVKAGLIDMSNALFRFTRPGRSLKELTDYLDQSKQQPVTTHNSNEDTGEMAIVRTRRPLAGTRYFHAQYFSENGGDGGFVQHMSFEFQPGPTAMADSVSAIQQSFSLGAPDVRRSDYVLWNLDDGRILWIKKMTAEDLQDDPFNAYSSNDIGTVRVAIETEIH